MQAVKLRLNVAKGLTDNLCLDIAGRLKEGPHCRGEGRTVKFSLPLDHETNSVTCLPKHGSE